MTARKRARRVDTERISAEERELRWIEGGDPVVQPAQPAWTTGAAAGAAPARLILAVVVLIITGVSLACGDARRLAARPFERQADRMRTRLNFREFVGNMTEKEFSRYYRIPRARAAGNASSSPQSFEELVAAITPPAHELARQQARARHTTGGYVGHELRVSMALRYLAGGSYLDIMYLHGVGRTCFYRYLWPTLDAIDKALPEFSLEDDIHDLERCRHLAAGFARKTDGHIRGAVAALDGIIFKVERPAVINNEEVVNPNKFNCRKGFPGVSCQAACDADRRITFLAIDFAASVHDSRAFRIARTSRGTRMSDELSTSTVLRQRADTPELRTRLRSHPYGFFLLADDAYAASDTMCVPWVSVRGKPYRDSFNHQQSRGRINIECAFGMLTRKFLVLSRPMMMSIPRLRTTVRAAAKLHNLCVGPDGASRETGIYTTDFTGVRSCVGFGW